jgi:hypothetical protein
MKSQLGEGASIHVRDPAASRRVRPSATGSVAIKKLTKEDYVKFSDDPNEKRGTFSTSGESPPQPAISPQLAEELAEILAEALAEDLRRFSNLRTSDLESQHREALAVAAVTQTIAITTSTKTDERRTKWTTSIQAGTPKKSTSRADIPEACSVASAAA